MKSFRIPFRTPLAALALAGLSVAQAPEVREMFQETAWRWYTGVSASYVQTNVIDAGYRIVDIEYDPGMTNPLTVAAVRNTGSYASGWWWYYGLTFDQVGDKLSQNQARLIDLERYVDNGNVRYACVMVPNTGNNAKGWGYYSGVTQATLSSYLANNNMRILDLDSYVSGNTRYYVAVMIKNTGSDARSWWWYIGQSGAQVLSTAQNLGARVTDLEDLGNGTFSAVYVKPTGGHWWFYYGQSLSQVTALCNQNGARPIDIERSGNTFCVVMVNNSNALETRIGDILRGGTNASTGCYLEQIGGGVRADLQGSFVFEPASTLKTVYHVHAMKRVAMNALSLGMNWNVGTGITGNSCPNGGAPVVNETVETTLKLMMENSDNARTRRVADYYGYAALNATASSLGMSSTGINHVIGCGGPTPNELTLRDIATLHKQVAGGYLGAQRQKFYDLMVNGTGGWPTWGTLKLTNIIDQEAAKLGIPASMVTKFKSNTDVACKAGSYGVNSKFYWSIGGYIALPFVVNGQIVQKEYAAGTFAHGGSNETALKNALGEASAELLRDEVRAALLTWDDVIFGSFTKFATGCAGSNGTPLHDGAGNPTVGNTIAMTVENAPFSKLAVLYVGASKTYWDRIPLPLHLSFLGANGCYLRVSPDLSFQTMTGRTGTGAVQLQVPNTTHLVGLILHTQFVCVDPGANALGLTYSNGMTTEIGGQK